MTIPPQQSAELSDVELLCRAVDYSPLCGFGIIEKWRAVGVRLGVDEAVARRLCKRFGVDPDKLVVR